MEGCVSSSRRLRAKRETSRRFILFNEKIRRQQFVNRLLEATVTNSNLPREIEQLLEKRGAELDRGPRITAISRFIEIEMDRLESAAVDNPSAAPPVTHLNDLFRETLAEVWGANRMD